MNYVRTLNVRTQTFLHVVLYTAERAWSHATEKRQLPDGPNARQRIYLIGTLRKAVKWADLFSHLCSVKGDSRTSLEAEAYASYMKGNLLFEQDRNWDTVLRNFNSATAVYEELGKYGNVENQVLCRECVEELEPCIRYCLHKIGGSNLQTAELLQIGEMEAVMAEARSQQAASLTEFHWLGNRFPITNEKTRVAILKEYWVSPFELMYDVSDYTAGEVLGQSQSIPLGNKVIVHTDHSAIKYLVNKKDANLGLLDEYFVAEFNLEIYVARVEKSGMTCITLLGRTIPIQAMCRSNDPEMRTRRRTQRDPIPLPSLVEGTFLQSGFIGPPCSWTHMSSITFDVWRINFMVPFLSSFGDLYILLVVDYVFKWVEAATTPKNDSKTVLKFFQKNIFTHFGAPRGIISDEGTHFDNKLIAKVLQRCGVRHKIATSYHPQTNRQAEVSNREIKKILEKVVNPRRRDWSPKLDEALWAYRKTFKMLLGMSPFKLIYGKACPLLVELKHQAFWSVKKLNAACWRKEVVGTKCVGRVYSSSLWRCPLKLFPGKLKSRWLGTFLVHQLHSHRASEIKNLKDRTIFKVNGQRLKAYNRAPIARDKSALLLHDA
ncbi:Signal recognition particle-related / SRP-related isoform 3 [Hibiscus syriacus]|uniref:Signal recognition particle subunit SRP68 n=1 Tax=Hibiscus syriacus TaxID=106335 RepID=A0A6A2YHR1_HIBSY|nr:Signal recognition particle-related / SRP-related isoform 3 [Hibiscus syriacus]